MEQKLVFFSFFLRKEKVPLKNVNYLDTSEQLQINHNKIYNYIKCNEIIRNYLLLFVRAPKSLYYHKKDCLSLYILSTIWK